MSLYETWENEYHSSTNPASKAFWRQYFDKEKEAYRDILSSGKSVITGRYGDLANRFGLEEIEMIGFMDGIADSLNNDLGDLEEYDSDSDVTLDINFEKLLYEMHVNKARWLFKLKEWDNILSPERQKEIYNQFRSDHMVTREKIGRNEPCPCGSGKKYKKCCGRKKAAI